MHEMHDTTYDTSVVGSLIDSSKPTHLV
jgi:hypothetical protein